MLSTDSHWITNQLTEEAPPKGLPQVSVLVPVYRPQKAHLRQAIESVLGQTYANFELILLDDCPEEPSGEVVRSFADPRIRYSANERNLGIAESRNRLIEMTKGEYLAVLDHDDICMPTRLEKQVAYLMAHPDVGVVSSQLRYMSKHTESCYPAEDDDVKMALMYGCAIPHTAAMIRRSVLENTGLRYEKEFFPAEDFRLWARLFAHTRFHNLQEALVEYRDHGKNTSERERRKRMDAHWRIVSQLRLEQAPYYAASLALAKSVTRVYMFALPVLKIETYRDVTTLYLFAILPFLRYKKKLTI